MDPLPNALTETGSWTPGETIGRYDLLAKIAQGGMAEIWLARQAGPMGFQKVVVVKRISDDYCEDPEFVELFLDEARIAAQLSHPHIVQIFELGEHNHAFYIAMEYLHGESFAAVLRKGIKLARPPSLSFVARTFADAAEGLAHAHNQTGLDGKPMELVHRDISPQNLFVTYDGIVKVLDFGIAKAAARASKTSGGRVRGKLSYMAPEQARNEPVDGRADIFALGVVMFEMLTRKRLFHFENELQALSLVGGNSPIPGPAQVNPEVPIALDVIVRKALARDVRERFQNAQELQGALEEWLRKETPAPVMGEVATYMKGLFPERIAERAALIEQARGVELTPGRLRGMFAESQKVTGPSRKVVSDAFPMKTVKPRRVSTPVLAFGGTLLSLLIGGTIVALSTTGSAAPPPAVVAQVARGTLTIESEPPGATIRLDGRVMGTAPLTVKDVAVGDHAVFANLPGRSIATRTAHVTRAGENVKVVLVVKPEQAEALSLDVAPVKLPGHAKTPAKAKVVGTRGKLTLDTSPWTSVYLGTRLLGDTPLVTASLPVGKHALKLVNSASGINQTVEVEIKPNELTVKKFKF